MPASAEAQDASRLVKLRPRPTHIHVLKVHSRAPRSLNTDERGNEMIILKQLIDGASSDNETANSMINGMCSILL